MSVTRTTKRRMSLMSVIVFMLCVLLTASNTVFAEPYLQLDANPATYDPDPDEESIITLGDVFTLYALVDSEFTQGGVPLFDIEDKFYISVAIIPNPGAPVDGEEPFKLGSFTFDGFFVEVVKDMDYGIPPITTIEIPDPKSLGPHGVFETYFEEISFYFDPSKRAGLYNSMNEPGGFDGGLEQDPSGRLYYQEFMVDASLLDDGYFLHFDLYNAGIDNFAPYSHDVTHTPVPGAVLLGLLGLGVAGIKLRKFA